MVLGLLRGSGSPASGSRPGCAGSVGRVRPRRSIGSTGGAVDEQTGASVP